MLRHKKNSNNMSIAYIGDEVLNKKAKPVSDINSVETQELIDKMFDIMHKEKGIGLAAPQVNISKRIITIDSEGKQFALINPKITKRSKDFVLFTEGCLSVPGKEIPIIRHQEIIVQYVDRNNKKQTLDAKGLLAIICQHEIDHLNGLLITDRFEQQQILRQTLNVEEKYE